MIKMFCFVSVEDLMAYAMYNTKINGVIKVDSVISYVASLAEEIIKSKDNLESFHLDDYDDDTGSYKYWYDFEYILYHPLESTNDYKTIITVDNEVGKSAIMPKIISKLTEYDGRIEELVDRCECYYEGYAYNFSKWKIIAKSIDIMRYFDRRNNEYDNNI